MPPKYTIEPTKIEAGMTIGTITENSTTSDDKSLLMNDRKSTFDISLSKETAERTRDLLWRITVSSLLMPILKPKRIIHNRKNGSTIVIWGDGSKTMVRPLLSDRKSPYSAFTAALAKKIYGNNSQVNKIVSMTEEPMPHKAKKKEGESDS